MPHSSAVCDFGWKAPQFNLPSTKGSDFSLQSAKGENGTLIMFICNHCPYVVSVLDDTIYEARNLQKLGINVLAICSNDAEEYPQDSFENMKKFDLDQIFSYFQNYLGDILQRRSSISPKHLFQVFASYELRKLCHLERSLHKGNDYK